MERKVERPAARGSPGAGPRLWVLFTASLSPIVLVGGWVLAGRLQDDGFSPVQKSVSFLASYGAQDRWVMTSALVFVGCLNIATACGLTGVRWRARIVLAAGGVSTILVAVFPQPAVGSSLAHVVCAVGGALLLTVWVALAGDPTRASPYPLTVRGAWSAAALIGLVVLALLTAAQMDLYMGLLERVCTGLQTSWPLVAVVSLRRRPARVRIPALGATAPRPRTAPEDYV